MQTMYMNIIHTKYACVCMQRFISCILHKYIATVSKLRKMRIKIAFSQEKKKRTPEKQG